jgi:hypothetical protein
VYAHTNHPPLGSHFVPPTPSRTYPNISAMLTQLPYAPCLPR